MKFKFKKKNTGLKLIYGEEFWGHEIRTIPNGYICQNIIRSTYDYDKPGDIVVRTTDNPDTPFISIYPASSRWGPSINDYKFIIICTNIEEYNAYFKHRLEK